MRGRKPKPTQFKRATGNPGKRRLNQNEPKPRASIRIDPAKIDETSRAFLERYVPLLQEARVLTDVDQAALELMSVHYALAWRAAQIVERDGLMVLDAFKQRHKHPLLQIVRDHSTAFRAYAAEFGMTPSSRSRVQTGEPKQLSLAEMLFGEEIPETSEGH